MKYASAGPYADPEVGLVAPEHQRDATRQRWAAYGLRRMLNRSRALRLSSALKLTLRAMMVSRSREVSQ